MAIQRQAIVSATDVAATLRDRIRDRRLKSGESLPTVRGLAETSGAAKNTVVRAYQILEGEGLVVNRGLSGRYVTTNLSEARYRGAVDRLAAVRKALRDEGYDNPTIERAWIDGKKQRGSTT